MENSVTFVKSKTRSIQSNLKKEEIRNKGRPTPDMSKEETAKSRKKDYIRKFNCSLYDKHDWISGNKQITSLFYFLCLIFGGERERT